MFTCTATRPSSDSRLRSLKGSWTFHSTSLPPPDTDPDENPKNPSSLIMCPSRECFQKAVLPVVIYFGELYLPCICWEFPSLTKYKKERVGPGGEVDEDGMSPQRASPHREMASVIPLAHLLQVRARDPMPRRGRDYLPPPICFQGGRGKLALFLVVTAQGVMDCGFNPILPILRLLEIDPRL